MRKEIKEFVSGPETVFYLSETELLMLIAWAAQRMGGNRRGALGLRCVNGEGWWFQVEEPPQ